MLKKTLSHLYGVILLLKTLLKTVKLQDLKFLKKSELKLASENAPKRPFKKIEPRYTQVGEKVDKFSYNIGGHRGGD